MAPDTAHARLTRRVRGMRPCESCHSPRGARASLPRLLTDPLAAAVGTVIANPMGDDEDDFPAGTFLEGLEDEALCYGNANELVHPASKLQKKDA